MQNYHLFLAMSQGKTVDERQIGIQIEVADTEEVRECGVTF